MKIAAILIIFSVCYITNTEQAQIGAPSVYTYPRSWDEIKRKIPQEMMKMKSTAYSGSAKVQINIPNNPQELQQCANQDCLGGEDRVQ